MTSPARAWDRLPTETLKAHTAFLAYVALGARRSVHEAARAHHGRATAAGEIHGRQKTTVRTWEGWSSKHKWVSRANARDAWLARVEDDQIVANLKACMLALTTAALRLLESGDSREVLRAARALSLHFPPIQRMEDVSERFEDLSDLSDEALNRMKEIRDSERAKNEQNSVH